MADPTPTDPAAYAHWVTERVRFSDTDAMGHVNNVSMAAHIESGRVALSFDLLSRLDVGDRTIILRRLEVDYLAEVRFPAELRVGSRLAAVGRTSFTVETGVFRDDVCVATSRGVLVVVGPDGPAPIEGEGRALLEGELPGGGQGRGAR
jgi:acyl-CoA thioester hydrolase